ncbi:hypothetical protein JOC33_003458 [Thalassobacillus pellis]|nr:hypothetical protein [Thalassobacillus pellis]
MKFSGREPEEPHFPVTGATNYNYKKLVWVGRLVLEFF